MAAATKHSEGLSIDYTPGSAVTAGTVTVLSGATAGKIVAIPSQDIAANVLGSLDVSGIWEVDAKGTDVFAIGEKVYWDAGNSHLTVTSSGNTLAGVIVAAKANGPTRAKLLLSGAGV
jgi:predicted RecA/RadA family phage recombinase